MERGPLAAALTASAVLIAGVLLVPRWRDDAPGVPVDVGALPASPEVEFAGCAAVLSGPRCELEAESQFRVWVGAREVPEFELDGKRVQPLSRFPVAGGTLSSLAVVPLNSRQLLVQVPGRRTFRLALGSAERDPRVTRAEQDRKAGNLEDARRALPPDLETLPETERGWAHGVLGRMELAEGNLAEAQQALTRAIEEHRRKNLISQEAEDTFALVFLLTRRRERFAEARLRLEQLEPQLFQYPEGLARRPYYEALLAVETGNYRAAHELLQESRLRAERLGLDRLERDARMEQSFLLLSWGRNREAIVSLQKLSLDFDPTQEDGATSRLRGSSAVLDPCQRVDIDINLGWAAIVAREVDPEAPDEPVEPLERALKRLGGECRDSHRQAIADLNLAIAALERHDPGAAEASLGRAGRVIKPSDLSLSLWALDVAAQIALAKRQPAQALALYEKQEQRAHRALLVESEWRATLGRARALTHLKRTEAALRAYQQAESALDASALQVPLGEGRDTFISARDRGARQHLELLVRLGRGEEALSVARRARARALRTLEHSSRIAALSSVARRNWEESLGAYRRGREELERAAAEEWKLPQDRQEAAVKARRARGTELRAELEALLGVSAQVPPRAADLAATPGPGELILAWFPAEKGWFGFAQDAQATLVRELGAWDSEAPPEVLAKVLLEPFAMALDRAERIRVLPYGALRELDLHALPYRGAPLLAHAAVEYPLDLNRPAGGIPAVRTALLVADPQGNLPAARREIDDAARMLRSAGSEVTLLAGDLATGAAVRRGVASVAMLHFAGHGVFAGHDGWESALPLAEGGRLTLGDVLALPRVPRQVLLTACESGRSSSAAPESLGLGQAFVLAGAELAIAPLRPVEDLVASEFSRLFYAAWLNAQKSPVQAVQKAQLELRQRFPDQDWAAYRVIAP